MMGKGARLVAVALLLAALMPGPEGSGAGLLVVNLEGAGLPELRRRARTDGLKTLAGLLGSGVGGPLVADGRLYGADLWRSLLAVPDGPWIWDFDGQGVITVGVPDTEVGVGAVVVPGEVPAQGFIGDSTGRVVSKRAAKAGGLGWPYLLSGGAIMSAVGGLVAGSWSPWLRLAAGDGRNGIFKVFRLDRDTLYLSPVYRRHFQAEALGLPDELAGMTYVADVPSWVGASSRLTEYYAAHLEDLTAARATIATALAAGDWRMLVYHEPLLLQIAAAYPAQPERMGKAYGTLERRLTKLLAAAGPDRKVVILASAGSGAGARGFIWFADGKRGRSEQPVDASEVAATLAELAGLDLGGRQGPASAALLARNWRFGAWRLLGGRGRSGPEALDLDAGRMRAMGILTTTASVGGVDEVK